MSREYLNFSTNAKLEKLIGRELITNNIIAIFELLKNSYDAFSDTATVSFENFVVNEADLKNRNKRNVVVSKKDSIIVISDNGVGMSFEEVKTKWMEIGTTSKEGFSELEVNSHKRTINGEKGIGRFGTDKLGSKLRLISVGASGYEKTTLTVDWNLFDDHSKKIQDISFECDVEWLEIPCQTGLRLEISSLRDKWTNGDIVKLQQHLKKLVSPFSQEQENFKIYLQFEKFAERIINDSFEYATTGIETSIDANGLMCYEIFTELDSITDQIQIDRPTFGPVRLKILYMDRAAKIAFTKRTGTSTKDYGNIKLFRDNFRVLPYGEKENDWLGIDNKHAQGAFRTFGTRDIVGYVQISKVNNPLLRDATSRQGLNEDIDEFEDFKNFIWKSITILQDYIFSRIKQESEKQGEVIKTKVREIKTDISSFEKEIPALYNELSITSDEKEKLIEKTNAALKVINDNVSMVEQANKQLSNRVKVMEKMVGAENRLYDMLHAIKNRLVALDAVVKEIEVVAEEYELKYNRSFVNGILKDISNMVLTAMRRSSPKRKKRDTIILSDFIGEFIEESKRIYPEITFDFEKTTYQRIFINVEELKISLENLLDNSLKAMKNEDKKTILIYIRRQDKFVKLYFEDSGCGVSKEDAPFIFNVSYSGTNGTGIGLPSVLDFMKEEGGDINLMEHGVLKGASFELTFPIKGGI